MTRPTLPQPARLPTASRGRRRRGVILLFVVVLLTLLAVLGSAYLVTSRIDAANASPAARGGAADAFNPDLRDPIQDANDAVVTAAQRAIFDDIFERTTVLQFTGSPVPNSSRRTTGILWRPSRETADSVFGFNPHVSAPIFNGVGDATAAANLFGMTADAQPSTYNTVDPLRVPYLHVDGEGGTDSYLASRTPYYNDTGTPPLNDYVWPWVSAPLAGLADFRVDNVFYDPLAGAVAMNFDASATSDALRSNVIPTATAAVTTPAPADVQSLTGSAVFYNDRTRQYPALFSVAGNFTFTAGDADGDGVADAGLVPFVQNNTYAITDNRRYRDPQTGLVYLYAVRIVDNNAAVNANTALRVVGDLNLTPAPRNLADSGIRPDGRANGNVPFDFENSFTAPNWGIYPTNVGLYELWAFDNDMQMFNGAGTATVMAGGNGAVVNNGYGFGDNNTGRVRASQFLRFLPDRLGNAAYLPVTDGTAYPYNPNNGPTPPTYRTTPRLDVYYGTLGELVTMNQTRLLGVNTGGNAGGEQMLPIVGYDFTNLLVGPRAAPFRGTEDEASLLLHGGGWLRKDAAASRIEQAAEDGLRTWAFNHTANPAFAFDFLPIAPGVGNGSGAATDADSAFGLRAMWAAGTKIADPDGSDFFGALTASGVTGFRNKGVGGVTATGAGTFPLSPRDGIVARNGVSQVIEPKLLAGPADPSILRRANSVPTGMPAYDDVRNENTIPNTDPPFRSRDFNVVPPVKAGANTSRFNELWRAYFNIMAAKAPGLANTNGPTGASPDAGFDAPPVPTGATADVFDPALITAHAAAALPAGNGLSREQVLLLRAALSAVNTMDIRDVDRVDQVTGAPIPGDNDVTVAEVDLGTINGAANPAAHVYARVYGTEAQPFIDEVLADYDPVTMAVTGIAVELFNPYPFPINMDGWQLAVVDRTTNAGAATLVPVATFSTADGTGLIPATDLAGDPTAVPATPATYSPGMMFVGGAGAALPAGVTAPTDNTATPPTDETPRIATSNGTGPTPTTITLAPLTDPAGGMRELVLIRPARNDLTAVQRAAAYPTADDYIPIDSVDFRGITAATVMPPAASGRVRFARPTAGQTVGANSSVTRDWDYVYAGPWSATPAGMVNNAFSSYVRQILPPPTPEPDYIGQFGMVNTQATEDTDVNATTPPKPRPAVPAPVVPVQVGPVLAGPWRAPDTVVRAAGELPRPTYPYGGFARDGDVLNVPFVGGYQLRFLPAGGGVGAEVVVDFVSLDLDLAFAHADAASASSAGHFYEHAVAATPDNWAADFFDYITALKTPGEDRFPQADPRYQRTGRSAGGTDYYIYRDATLYARPGTPPAIWDAPLPTVSLGDFSGSPDQYNPAPPPGDPVVRQFFQTLNPGALAAPLNGFDVGLNTYNEAFSPVEGLVNLNTAPTGILKLLPLVVNATGNVTPTLTSAPAGTLFGARLLATNFTAGSGADDAPGTGGTGAGGGPGNVPLQAPPAAVPAPFTSLFNLRDITVAPFNDTIMSGTQPQSGDITGRINVDGGVVGMAADTNNFYDATADFEQNTQQLTRLSNLTTTRSDSFTVYIVVEAWRLGTGAADPARLMRQQRTAFVVDRSNVLPFVQDTTVNPPVFRPWAPADVDGDFFKTALRLTPVPTQ